jgi:hypothetical protein
MNDFQWIWIGLAFSGFGSRSLLIQRCKNYAPFRHFFVQGAFLPDERHFCPTNGKREEFPTFAVEKVLSYISSSNVEGPRFASGLIGNCVQITSCPATVSNACVFASQ